jgi:hypothetical protein
MTFAAAARFYPFFELVLLTLLPAKFRKMQKDHYQVALDKIHRRMNLEKQRDDLMTPVLNNNPNFQNMSLEEIESTFSLLIVAGSETTATALSGITNELVKAPSELQKLVSEVRGTFKNTSEITFEALGHLPFLDAVCHEGLRVCNPIPAGLPRVVPKGGGIVSGHFLPEYVSPPPFDVQFVIGCFEKLTHFRQMLALTQPRFPSPRRISGSLVNSYRKDFFLNLSARLSLLVTRGPTSIHLVWGQGVVWESH